MKEKCATYGVKIWTYCLMPNHIHLIAVPSTEAGFAKAIGGLHEAYSRYINFRNKWNGYLWQGRFGSYVMDDQHLLMAARYIEMNPVKAGIVKNPEDYPWSSAQSHISGKYNDLLETAPFINWVSSWKDYLIVDSQKHDDESKLEIHGRTGRPLGSIEFVKILEKQVGRPLLPSPPGRKRIEQITEK